MRSRFDMTCLLWVSDLTYHKCPRSFFQCPVSRILGPMQNKCPVFYVSGPTFRVPDPGSQNSSMSCVWGLCPTSRVSGARSRVSPTRWVPGLTSQVSPKVAGLGYHFLDMLGETCLTPAIGWKPEKCFQKQKFKI